MVRAPSDSRRVWQPLVLLAVVALIAGALLTVRSGRVPPEDAEFAGPQGDDLEAAVASLLRAERAGDVPAYQAHLADAALREFEARLGISPAAQIAAELRSGLADLKGHATFDLSRSAPDAAAVGLELIFADRNERQQLELRRIDGVWKVTRRTLSERHTPEIPYGAPVVPTPDDAHLR